MSYQNRLRSVLATGDADVAFAKAGLILSIGLLSLWLVGSRPLLLVIPVSSGSACAFYLAVVTRQTRDVGYPTLPRHLVGYIPSLVVAGLAAYVALVWIAGERTVLAYLVVGAIGTCLLGQVLLTAADQLDPRLVLAEILGVAVVLRFAGLFATPGFAGVDIWTHVPVYVQGIVDAGSLSALAESKYVMAPIYHAYSAVATLTFGSARLAVYLTLGVVIPLAVLFVYGAGRLVLPARWALLATALYAFADQFVQWGIRIIPTSVGLVFFLALVYFVTRLFVGDAEWWAVALAALCSLAIVFTHQVTTAVLIVFLLVATLVALALDVSRSRTLLPGLTRQTLALVCLSFTTTAITLVTWANTPHSGDEVFLPEMLDVISFYLAEQTGFLNLASDSASPVPAPVPAQGQTLLGTLVPYLELVGFGLLLSLAIVGGLGMLRWSGSRRISLTYLVTTVVFFTVVFGFSLVGFGAVLPGRWQVFMYVPMAIVAAAGLYYVSQTASRRAILAVVVVLAVCFPVTMVTAETATPDSPAFADQHTRLSYTESELAALGTIKEIHPPAVAGPIHTDHPYKKLFEQPVSGYEAATLPVGQDGALSDRPIVYRQYQSTGPVTWHTSRPESDAVYTGSLAATEVCHPSRNVVYANDQVKLCLPTESTAAGSTP